MAVDPFTQQIVQFYSCSAAMESARATVPFSNNYTTVSPASNPGRLKLDPRLHSAIYIGLLSPLANTSAAVQFECSTGNCTFPSTDDGATFQSLALESHCTNISSHIVFSTTEIAWNPEDDDPYENMTTASLPQYDISLTVDSLRKSMDFFKSGQLAYTTGWWPSSFFNKVAYLITSTDFFQPVNPQNTYAFECEFYPVVQIYNAKIQNGVLREKVLGTQRMNVWFGNYSGIHALLLADRTIRKGKWHECTSRLRPSTEHSLPVNISVDPLSLKDWSIVAAAFSPEQLTSPFMNITWWPQDCVYWLPYEIAGKLPDIISNVLGTETLSHSLGTEQWTPWLDNIWNDGHPTLEAIQAIMDGLTQAVTARLRQGDGVSVNAGPAIGTAWGIQTCVHVNWGWIALPAGMLLLTIIFLALTISRTSSEHARVWKSSIFAVLFSGPDQKAKKADGPVASLEEMKAAADRSTVRLEDTKDGFRLVSQT